ncbi:cytochrome c [Chitinimonas sp.]|uniref:cytochrome c n=1 Tax=Chitinimonas sp. TaxID=1934313 RepID=UPI002F92117D
MSHAIFRPRLIVPLLILLLAGVWFWLPGWQEEVSTATAGNVADPVARGRYLATAGDCLACHTARGGAPYAGGRVLQTAYGDFVTPNITPATGAGLGSWSADDFWRALHYGRGKDGRFLYPAFPYPNYTKINRADSDALYAYLRTIAPVEQRPAEHQLDFPYNQRSLLRLWQALYFKPGVYQADAGQNAEWNRGAYLVQGLGHCGACHTSRDRLGGPNLRLELGGSLLAVQDWYAPSLTDRQEAHLAQDSREDLVALLSTGVSHRHAVFGPMAEVVYRSLQHLDEPDVHAMALYLQSLPPTSAPVASDNPVLPEHEKLAMQIRGKRLYQDLCINCHGKNGEGAPPAYPPLAGNRSLLQANPVNVVRMVLNGGFPPGTRGNPRPYGMPPFGPSLNDREVAAVASYIRTAWGNRGEMVAPQAVERYRTVPAD